MPILPNLYNGHERLANGGMEPGFSPLLQEVSRGKGEKPERRASQSALHQHEPTFTLVEIYTHADICIRTQTVSI